MQRGWKIALFSTVGILLLGLAGYFAYIAQPVKQEPINAQAIDTPSPIQKASIDELLARVNEERAKVGVAPMIIDAKLNQSAQMKADDMEKNNYFAHVSPKDGRHGYEYIDDMGVVCRTNGENFSWNTDGSTITANQAVGWWLGSESHRNAMLDPDYKSTGFGVVNSIIVEHFCQ